MAVFDLRAPGLPAGARRGLMATLTEATARAPWLEVVSRDEIAAMLDAEAQRQLAGCDDTSCLAEIAGALNVELIITGAVSPLGDSSVVTLQLINQRFANVMNRVSLTWPGEQRHLPEVLEAAVQLLVLQPEARPAATLHVAEAPPGAELLLDGERSGTADTNGSATIEGLTVGVHLLRITESDHLEREIPVVARAAEAVRISGALEPVPFHARWWFWAGVATAGVLAVGIPLTLFLTDLDGTVTISAPAEGPEGVL